MTTLGETVRAFVPHPLPAHRFIGSAPDLDLLNPVYGLPVAQPTDPLANYTQTVRQVGLYLQDHVKSVTDAHLDGTRLGVKYQPEGAHTLLTSAVFDLRKTNVVTYDNLTFDARQIGKQRSRGLELEAKTEPLPGLKASAAYTWLDIKTVQSADRTEVGKAPSGVPRQSASLWLDYLVGSGFGVGGGVTFAGRRQNDEANTSSEPSVTLYDAALHYELDTWRFALNVRKLFDRRYYGICYHGECYSGLERTVTLTARVRF